MTIELANRLIEFRRKHNLSQEQLADKLHVSRQTISKWERSESSPDTDNLIELAKLYNIPLDDLLNCTKDVDSVLKEGVTSFQRTYSSDNEKFTTQEEDNLNSNAESSSKDEKNKTFKDGEVHVDFGPFHVHTSSDDGDSVYVGKDGIHVQEKGGDSVHISSDGIKINNINVNDYKNRKNRYTYAKAILSSVCFAAFVISYLCLGFLLPNYIGWISYWPLMFFVIFIPSIVEAIEYKQFSKVTVPLLVVGIYLILGMRLGLWHPYWVLFLFIPVYYICIDPIDKLIKVRQRKKSIIDGDYTVDDDNGDDDDDD